VIPASHAHLRIAAASNPGMKGKLNEDRYSVSAYHLTSDDRTPSVLALLADGIGGHHAGEIAAQLAVDSINRYVAGRKSNQPAQVLKQALTYTNQIILDRAKADPKFSGMGTTCVCSWVIGSRLYAASVGDSRLYLLRGSRIQRLTIDHTWVQEALAQGTLMPDQVKGHPNAHIIRRFLGTTSPLDPDLRLRLSSNESDTQAEANQGLRLFPGDRLLLCSDGLTDLVQDAEILDVNQSTPVEGSPARLIDLANQRGGHDNITVVILEVPQPAHITQPIRVSPAPVTLPAKKPPRSAVSWAMIFLLLVAILLMALLLAYLRIPL
jgi:serine/threonine protein phosphatase PrpC